MGATPQPPRNHPDGSGLIRWMKGIESQLSLLRERLNNPFANTGMTVPSAGTVVVEQVFTVQNGGLSQIDPGGDLDINGNANVSGTLNVGGPAQFGGSVDVLGQLTVGAAGKTVYTQGVLEIPRADTTKPPLVEAVGNVGGILGGSYFRFNYENGNAAMLVDETAIFSDGFTINRPDGSVAVGSRLNAALTDHYVTVRSRGGADLVSETPGGIVQSPEGLQSPLFEMPFRPVVTPVERTTTSSTMATLFEWRGVQQNSRLHLTLRVRCSDATTAGEVQVSTSGGTPLNSAFLTPWLQAVPTGTTTDTDYTVDLWMPSTFGTAETLQVQARRTAGSGTVTVSVVESRGTTQG